MSRAARLGAFIVATLGILVLGVVIIGNHQYLFSSTYQLKSQFTTVAGLSAGADVQVGGVHSGTVRSIDLPHEPGILVLGVVIIGSNQYLFSSTYQLKSQFTTVAGLSAGADVQVGGVHSGTVRSIDLP